MNLKGLTLCSRYSYPPNSLHLCGPEKQDELSWYTQTGNSDKGTREILSRFSTLYPYLVLIASHNRLKDPFDPRVVEAYWLGNNLLENISVRGFAGHLNDTLSLRKKIPHKNLNRLLAKLEHGAFPHHSFHVLNVYKRTGNLDLPHTLETVEACLILWGKVKKKLPEGFVIETQPVKKIGNNLLIGNYTKRIIYSDSKYDAFAQNIRPGDWVSYHWGKFCQKLTVRQLRNLKYYTLISLQLANLEI